MRWNFKSTIIDTLRPYKELSRDQLNCRTKNGYLDVPVVCINKYLFKEVSAIKMWACLWVGPTTKAIHSFDGFIWTRQLSAFAIMRYCLPFDSASRHCTRHTTPDRDTNTLCNSVGAISVSLLQFRPVPT